MTDDERDEINRKLYGFMGHGCWHVPEDEQPSICRYCGDSFKPWKWEGGFCESLDMMAEVEQKVVAEVGLVEYGMVLSKLVAAEYESDRLGFVAIAPASVRARACVAAMQEKI